MTVTACSATSLTATVASTAAGQVFQLPVFADATGTGPWTDEGTVVTQGETEPVDATAYRYGGGGSGTGETPSTSPTPTPTVSESPSSSQSPSPSPSASPTKPVSVLARTGVELTAIAALGAALLVAGFLLVIGSRMASRTAPRRH
ncbi:hypothetical protein GCM10023153_30490 [Ornithinibacter aureus]|uniref:Uncharacterized protein n=2 Tax=Ornithinibacter aureus TaxID=622664 RepID=A0ABP8K9A1_9MICO|nr:hypothetical protein C8E84_1388 [Ornithinibacter aureus]